MLYWIIVTKSIGGHAEFVQLEGLEELARLFPVLAQIDWLAFVVFYVFKCKYLKMSIVYVGLSIWSCFKDLRVMINT